MSYQFASPAEGRKRISELLRPPIRMKVSEAASQYVHVAGGVGAGGLWSAEATPYMVQPMDALNRRDKEAVVFVAPARTGKTQSLLDCWHGHNLICDPGDTGFFFPTQELAADYSKRRIDRMHRNSPDIGIKMASSAHADNIHMKQYRDGTILTIAWPSKSQLAQREFRYVALSDYDAIPADIDGDGNAYLLAKKRTQTAMSSGMTLVESSPRFDWIDPQWRPATPHEAPPVAGGALLLYNQGTRHRWYWRCIHCSEWFEATFRRLEWPDSADIAESAGNAQCLCPHCSALIGPEYKNELNANGDWLGDGQQMVDNKKHGETRRSNIDSYWLHGPAAAFQSWESLVLEWLRAHRAFEATGSEEALKTTTNVDQGLPYKPRRLKQERTVGELQQRAEREESWPKGTIPADARVLIASVDVQKASFVCQTIAFGPGREWWLVDRFTIHASKRLGEDGRNLPIDPAGFINDWEEIVYKVMDREYQTETGALVRPILTLCDSGGKIGVTPRAYDFYRRLRSFAHRTDGMQNLQRKFLLVKGASSDKVPMAKLHWPDTSARRDRASGAKGDVPVLFLNTVLLKDAVSADIKADIPGPGYGHIPPWIDPDVFDELLAEVRTPKGWEKIAERNEAPDLIGYAMAGLIYLGAQQWGDDWERCPYKLEAPKKKLVQARPTIPSSDWSFDRR